MPSKRAWLVATALLLAACDQEDDTSDIDGAVVSPANPSLASDAAQSPPAADAGTDSGSPLLPPSVSTPDTGAAVPSDERDAMVGTAEAGSGGDGGAGDAGLSTPGTGDGGTAYSPCPGNGEPCKILPLGDSITDGFGNPGGYRVELFNKSLRDNKPITFVGSLQNGPSMVGGKTFPRKHEGHSGWTIQQIAGLIPSPALNDPPHIVLLMAGTNDVNLNSNLTNAPKRLGALVDKIIAANADTLIVVAQITPFSRPNTAVTALNEGISDEVKMRADMGKHVLLVDMNTGFPMGGLGDVVHPNKMGHDWMAGVWYQAIAPSLR